MIEEFSVPNIGHKKGSLCQRRFVSDKYCYLHFDGHVHKGNLFPCYLCGKIFLTSWSFIRHQCLSKRKLPRKYLHDPAFKTPVNEIYCQLSPELRSSVLRCPVCGKQCEFLSQLLSHIHIGSGCLARILDSPKVNIAEDDLSLDLGPVLGVTQADSERLIQCASCSELLPGALSYLMHMDHHKLDTVLECIKCNKTAESNSVCQFYSPSCNEDAARACVFCEEMVVMRELGPLEKPDSKDLAKSVVELFTRMTEEKGDNTRDPGAEIR